MPKRATPQCGFKQTRACLTQTGVQTSPQRERVVALHLGGSIPHQEGPIRHVSQLIVHLLPENDKRGKNEERLSVLTL